MTIDLAFNLVNIYIMLNFGHSHFNCVHMTVQEQKNIIKEFILFQ